MASELDRLVELNNQLRLVGKGNDLTERERFCSAFTQEAARLLYAEGWRRIRKPDGKNVDGMDIDKLVNANTFRVVDLIVDAGLDRARVSFNDVGELRDVARFIEVKPVEVPPADDTPEPDHADDVPDALMQEIKNLVDGRDLTNHELDRIARALESIAKVVAAAGARIGVK